ncbi:acyl-CoA dehydrogenase family protein [Nocardia niwae]|uniref:Acyl-CoA dehydrogenase family protein n=1 Tax=Nocardia niwae TaxID=626084 RepID=A0ABV2XCB3_9NOCA
MNEDTQLLDTDIESALREVVRGLLADRCDPALLVRAYDSEHTLAGDLWKPLGTELGLAGLLVPESRGGAGGSARDAAVVCEEIGRFVAPVPFLTSSVLAATVALAGESDLVAQIAGGHTVAALLTPLSTTSIARIPAVHIDEAQRLSGRITSVAGALEADTLLAVVPRAQGLEIHALDASDAHIEPVVSLDMTRPLADIEIEDAPGRVVVSASAGETALRAALRTATAMLACEQVGIAAQCLDMTVNYVKLRRQFGRAVGGFQALKHRLADLYVEVETARAAARYAAATLAAADPDTETATALAAAYCSQVAVHVAEEAVQLHGGIGMTWEHPAHLYLKRAKADQIALGTPAHHRERLADLVGID